MVDLIERLNALLKQVRTVYICEDYLDEEYQRFVQQQGQQAVHCVSTCTVACQSGDGINEAWREKICEWSYQVVDHFEFSREVVSVSISLLDRFLCVHHVDKQQFQLAAMTTLYLAIKLSETGKLSMVSMIQLSRGFFTTEQMADMEMTILQSLSWRINPPTPFCLVRHMLSLLHVVAALDTSYLQQVLELSRFLTELSVIDYFFVTRCASSVAVAALLNSMETLGLQAYIPKCLEQLRLLDDLDPLAAEVFECRSRLQELFAQGDYTQPQPASTHVFPERTNAVSPACVADFSTSARMNMPIS